MKLKEDLILRSIAGEYVVIPIGNHVALFNGIISLNETASFLWKKMQSHIEREGLISALLDDYEVDEEQAGEDVDGFLKLLDDHELLIKD